MSATHDAEGQDRSVVTDRTEREPIGAEPSEKEPTWAEGSLDPKVVEAAKRVFDRRRDLLRRLA